MPSPRTLIVTGYDDAFAPVAALMVPRMRAYAERHGCDVRVVPSANGKDYYLTKIAPIQAGLADGYDFVFWIDADALILRLDPFFVDALPAGANLGLVWHALEGTGIVAHYNAGVMIVRQSAWAQDFFARVQGTRLPHKWGDQATILHLLGYDHAVGMGPERPDAPDRAHLAALDPAWNAIPEVATVPDPIVHHWAGIYSDARIRAIAADAALNAIRDTAAAPTRIALAETMNGWYREASLIGQQERMLRSPRLLMKRIPGLFGPRLKQALIPKSLRARSRR